MRTFALPMDDSRAAVREPDAGASPRSAFLAAARPQLDRAYRLAGLLLGDAHEAEDAVQDSLVVAWQSFASLRDPKRFGPWFDRILVNRCRDRLRRRRIVRFVPIEGEDHAIERDPFRSIVERDALLAGLDGLTPDERLVVVLRFWGDLRLEDIANRAGWPLGTVKSRLHRALARLRASLDGDRKEERR